MEFSTWLTFFAASWAISISPGAGAVAAMSAGLNHGFRRGYFTTFGLILGIWTQVLVVGAGLGALVAASSTAFSVVKWLGVAYLVWLGIAQWRAPARPMAALSDSGTVVTRRSMIMRAWMINAVNPKGTVFLLAVVPQFLSLAQPLLPQYLVIAATLAARAYPRPEPHLRQPVRARRDAAGAVQAGGLSTKRPKPWCSVRRIRPGPLSC